MFVCVCVCVWQRQFKNHVMHRSCVITDDWPQIVFYDEKHIKFDYPALIRKLIIIGIISWMLIYYGRPNILDQF